jgi:hypothetical protein
MRQQNHQWSNTATSCWIRRETHYFRTITLHPLHLSTICRNWAFRSWGEGGGLGSLVTLRRHNWWQMLRSVGGQRSICVVESSVEGISETDFMFSCFLYRFPNAINICATSVTTRYRLQDWTKGRVYSLTQSWDNNEPTTSKWSCTQVFLKLFYVKERLK